MSNDTRGSNRPRRPRVTKSNNSGNNAGSGRDKSTRGAHFKDENRHDASKRGNWNDSGNSFRTDSVRKKGPYNKETNLRNFKSRDGRSNISGNNSNVNLRGERRFSGTDRREGKDFVKPKRTNRSEITVRNSSSGGRRTYNPKSGSNNSPERGQKSYSSPGGSRNDFQNRKGSGRTGTFKTRSTRGKSISDSGEMRLNRFIAHSGICSRRQADEFIKAGLVSINGQIVSDMGIKVKPDDIVKYNGETIRSEKKVYILLNKPKNYVTTLDDEENRKTVMELINDACPERVYPVGRLDRNTTGVMLLTNDGELTGKLTHPRYNKKKIYHVFLDKNLKKEDLQSITEGVTLEDGPITPDSISYVDSAKKSEIGVEIHSGRNRIVRRLFEYFGYKVIRLDRVYFAGLTKKNLARGKWRFLTEKEIYTLKMNSYE